MSQKLKIGLVTGEFPPLEGGVGAYTDKLAQELIKAGHEVHIFTSRRAKPKIERKRSETIGEALQKINDINEPIHINDYILHARFRRWNWAEMSIIAESAIRFELDVVHVQYQAAAFNMRRPAINYLPWRLKWIVPSVVTYHDLKVPYLFPKAGRLRDWVVNSIGRHADGVIVTNQADYSELSNRIQTPISSIPIGSNIAVGITNHIEIGEIRDKLELSEDDVLLGYFGFLHPSKGGSLLIDALSRLDKRYHLFFIGGQTGSSDATSTSPYLDEIKGTIEAKGLSKRVHWSGFVPDERVSALLSAADLMVLPYQDGASVRRGSLMAALAHGKPILTTFPDAPADHLTHKKNIYCVDNHVDALVEGIRDLSGNRTLQSALGEAARESSAQFEWPTIAEKTINLYRDTVAKRD